MSAVSTAIAASLVANKKLQKGISPGVRASGPFAKHISQANKAQQKAKNKSMVIGSPMMGYGVVKAPKSMGSKFGKK